MVFGIKSLGKMKSYQGQAVCTRFIIIILPILPVESLFQLANGNSISLGKNTKSILKTYLSWLLLLLGLLGVLSTNFSHAFPVVPPLFSLLGGLICLALSGYFFFRFQHSTPSENELRDLMQAAIGINALPSYFSYDAAYDFQLSLKRDLKDRYHIKNWRDVVDHKTYSNKELPLLFSILAFQDRMSPSAHTHEIYLQLKAEFESALPLKK